MDGLGIWEKRVYGWETTRIMQQDTEDEEKTKERKDTGSFLSLFFRLHRPKYPPRFWIITTFKDYLWLMDFFSSIFYFSLVTFIYATYKNTSLPNIIHCDNRVNNTLAFVIDLASHIFRWDCHLNRRWKAGVYRSTLLSHIIQVYLMRCLLMWGAVDA